MSETLIWAARDTGAFIGRSLRHSVRSVDTLVVSTILPVAVLLMFVEVFGGAIRAEGRYVDYVVPGIILLAAGFGSASTAVSVCQDMTTGVVDRFRSMPITGFALLAGHVVAGIVRNAVSTTLVLGVALVLGFRPVADPVAWLGVAGILLVFMAAVAWLSACFGLLVRDVEAANAASFIVMFLPYVSSAFVPTATMPAGLRWVADHQPITPVVETLRGLMFGTSTGGHAPVAVAWCLAAATAGALVAALLYRRR
jgi:ABC-2 type transport system permease protein